MDKLKEFLEQRDENGVSNYEKVRKNQKIIRRLPSTDKNRSFEASESGFSDGIVTENGKVIGFGIHIYNEDVYPLQSFEIYLRSCGLTGELDISDCTDMVFLDIYHNKVSAVKTGFLPAMRIFGVQDNELSSVDVTGMPACQGIDAGMNRLTSIDVTRNPELVELYINNNAFTQIDLGSNPKLKYFYCHNNGITQLDTRANPLLRHLNATANPMKRILSLAPQRDERLPLELFAGDGGTVGLKFNPVYNAQWKETGEWQQSYYAYPDDGCVFDGWYDDSTLVSRDAVWIDEYGASRRLTARFAKK